ncbi:hypothetical protein LOAG_08411 [Loa loa]|uniref:Uncharacterized protein n=1 Tax=Loa loa TaxID=7209 RepID=A0A1S0TTT2_LOALO|nr:hypothetical protein LOAG_08411 [Loa loa]EFO20082.1 hypothetical protein LOAG_08411 [Loa loa]
MAAHKTFIIKRKLAKKAKQNRQTITPMGSYEDGKQDPLQCEKKTLAPN